MATGGSADDGGDGTPIDMGVIIVTYNSAAVLGGLLASLSAGLAGLRWRAVVVDNASSDSTGQLVAGARLELIRRPSNDGYAAAINDGVRYLAGAESYFILNPDSVLSADCGAALLHVLRTDPRVGIVAPRTLTQRNPPVLDPTLRREPTALRAWAGALIGGRRRGSLAWTSEAVTDPASYEQERDADWIVGAAMLIGRRCVDAVGEWDESFFLYSEEVDFCRRARRAGFAIRYTPAATIVHIGGDGLENPRLRAMMVINSVRDYARHHHVLAAWAFYGGMVLHEAVRAPRRGASRFALRALLRPAARPSELNLQRSLLPR